MNFRFLFNPCIIVTFSLHLPFTFSPLDREAWATCWRSRRIDRRLELASSPFRQYENQSADTWIHFSQIRFQDRLVQRGRLPCPLWSWSASIHILRRVLTSKPLWPANKSISMCPSCASSLPWSMKQNSSNVWRRWNNKDPFRSSYKREACRMKRRRICGQSCVPRCTRRGWLSYNLPTRLLRLETWFPLRYPGFLQGILYFRIYI